MVMFLYSIFVIQNDRNVGKSFASPIISDGYIYNVGCNLSSALVISHPHDLECVFKIYYYFYLFFLDLTTSHAVYVGKYGVRGKLMLIVGDIVFLDQFWTRTSTKYVSTFLTTFSRSNVKFKVQNP